MSHTERRNFILRILAKAMIVDLPFAEIMRRVRAGDEEACAFVFELVVKPLMGQAHRHLARHLRSKEDPEDVVQSACRSFFVRVRDGQFELGDWCDLWRLLFTITANKCSKRHDYYSWQKRNPNRERSLDREILCGELWPDVVAALNDEIDSLLRQLEPPERKIIDLTLQGFDTHEIAEIVNRRLRAIQRVQQGVRENLAQRN